MSTEKLVETLKKEGRLQRDAIKDKARETAEKFIAEAEKAVDKLETQISRERKKQQERIKSHKRSYEILESMAKKEKAINLYVESLLSLAGEMFREQMKSDDYANMVKEDLASIRKELGKVDEIRADKTTGAVLEKLVKPGEKLSVDGSLTDGFEVLGSGGKVKVIDTFGARLQKAWLEHAPLFINRIYKATENVA